MKVVHKEIVVLAWFDKEGNVEPLRFKTDLWGELVEIKVDRVRRQHLEKLNGNHRIVFECETYFDRQDVTKIYELKYEIATQKWILFKI